MNDRRSQFSNMNDIVNDKDHKLVLWTTSVVDPGFPRGGGTNSLGGRQYTILPNFPKNCKKWKEF